jgi:hypothetical protein
MSAEELVAKIAEIKNAHDTKKEVNKNINYLLEKKNK